MDNNNKKNLIIIGSGGHGRVVADSAELLGHYDNICFLDDSFGENNSNGKWAVIGKSDDWPQYQQADFMVAFSNNKQRHQLITTLLAANIHLITIVHPSASVSTNATLHPGVMVGAKAVINFGCTIGEGCIINTGATIDHDCLLEPAVHISPGVNVSGGVTIGQLSWLGVGSAIIECVTIAENTQTGAGAVITKDTLKNSLYLGMPAKRIKTLV